MVFSFGLTSPQEAETSHRILTDAHRKELSLNDGSWKGSPKCSQTVVYCIQMYIQVKCINTYK